MDKGKTETCCDYGADRRKFLRGLAALKILEKRRLKITAIEKLFGECDGQNLNKRLVINR